MILSDDLRNTGYQVIKACSADEALVLIENTLPDLIISDVRMPGSIDGMDLLGFVKQKHPALPMIITSGHFDARVALAAGASDFLTKPYIFAQMLRTMQTCINSLTEKRL